MIEYNLFREKFNEKVYSLKKIPELEIESIFNQLNTDIAQADKMAIDMIKKEKNLDYIPESIINDLKNTFDFFEDEYKRIIFNQLDEYLIERYGKYRIDKDGLCLMNKLIGNACQMRYNTDLLGVIRGVDTNPRFLIVDFGDESEVKIDVDELIISGQNS